MGQEQEATLRSCSLESGDREGEEIVGAPGTVAPAVHQRVFDLAVSFFLLLPLDKNGMSSVVNG